MQSLSIILLLPFSIAVYMAYKLIYYIHLSFKLRQHFPAVVNHRMLDFLFGQVFDISKEPQYTLVLNKWHQQYGPTYLYNFFFWPALCTIDPEFIKFVAIQSNKKTKRPSSIADILSPILGKKGLLLLEGDEHQLYKKLFLPLFNKRSMDAIFPFILNRANSVLNKLGSKELDLLPLFSQYTLDIISKLCFNYNLNSIESSSNISEVISQTFSTVDNNDIWQNIIPYYYQLPFAVNRRRLALMKELNSVIHNFMKSKSGYIPDVLQILMDNKNSYEEIRDHIMTFLLAGNETTSTTLGWMSYLLALNPKEQEILYKALINIDIDDAQALEGCDALNHVLYETLRIKPTVENSARMMTEAVEYKGKLIPKDTFILINITGMNMNCVDPLVFNPKRWETENGQYDFIPFYIGFRACIGKQLAMMELRVMASALIKNYKIEKTAKTLETKAVYHITQRPSPGIHVKLEKR